MCEQKFYYKLTRNDGEELYVKTDLPLKPEKLCEIFHLEKTWHAECISEEEYNFEDE